MGTLVDDPTIRPTAHIFVGSKAPWFTISGRTFRNIEAHVPANGPSGGSDKDSGYRVAGALRFGERGIDPNRFHVYHATS